MQIKSKDPQSTLLTHYLCSGPAKEQARFLMSKLRLDPQEDSFFLPVSILGPLVLPAPAGFLHMRPVWGLCQGCGQNHVLGRAAQ